MPHPLLRPSRPSNPPPTPRDVLSHGRRDATRRYSPQVAPATSPPPSICRAGSRAGRDRKSQYYDVTDGSGRREQAAQRGFESVGGQWARGETRPLTPCLFHRWRGGGARLEIGCSQGSQGTWREQSEGSGGISLLVHPSIHTPRRLHCKQKSLPL